MRDGEGKAEPDGSRTGARGVSEPDVLCVLTDGVWTTTGQGWAERSARRRLAACFVALYGYDGSHRVRVTEWPAAVRRCAVMVDVSLRFRQVQRILAALVADRPGLAVFSAARLDEPGAVEELEGTPGLRYVHDPEYGIWHTAAVAGSIAELVGHDPSCISGGGYHVGWFAHDDPLGPFIQDAWARWPAASGSPFLPPAPSASPSSLEVFSIGSEATALGLCLPDHGDLVETHADIAARLPDGMFAGRFTGPDFRRCLESGDFLENVSGLTAPLPFETAGGGRLPA